MSGYIIVTNSERREYNIKQTIEVAIQCFEERGIEATTQVYLAKKIGLTTKTLQRCFKSKEEIVLLAMEQLNVNYYETIEKRLSHSVMSGMDGLLDFLNAHEIFLEPENRTLLLMSEMHIYLARHDIQESRIWNKINAVSQERKYILRNLEKGVKDGSIRSDIDISLAYAFITSSFAGMIQRMMLLPDTYETNYENVTKKDIFELYAQKVKANLQP